MSEIKLCYVMLCYVMLCYVMLCLCSGMCTHGAQRSYWSKSVIPISLNTVELVMRDHLKSSLKTGVVSPV